MEEDVQDLDKDHEVSHPPSNVALNLVLQDSWTLLTAFVWLLAQNSP